MSNYNIGAGGTVHNDWVSVDHFSDWYCNTQTSDILEWDLLQCCPINVSSNSADNVYSSHTIEHITDEAVYNLCLESFRLLKAGGVFRLQAPNIDIFYYAFKKGNIHPWLYSKKPIMSIIPLSKASVEQAFVWSFASNATIIHKDGAINILTDRMIQEAFYEKEYSSALNYCKSFVSIDKQKKYPGNHINWWNPNKLIPILKDVGFKNVYESNYTESKSDIIKDFELFNYNRSAISFYVESQK